MWADVFFGVLIVYAMIGLVVVAQVCLANDFPAQAMRARAENLATGDILCVGYRHLFGAFITAWSGSVWSHTGIAWRDKGGKLFVLEAGNYGQNYNGVYAIPFALWLNINKSQHLAVLKVSGNFPSERLKDIFDEYLDVKLDTYSHRWARFLVAKPFATVRKAESYTCFELTILVLQRAGVIAKHYRECSYFPRQIVACAFPCTPGFSYAAYGLQVE